MEEAFQADAAALADVYRRMIRPLYRYVYRQVGNREDAEDIAAEVFVRATRWLRPEAGERQVRAWLMRAAKSAIREFWRATYRSPPLVDWDVERVAYIELAEEAEDEAGRRARREVEELLRGLPERYRRVLELRFLEGLSVRETAERMGVSEANAKVLQHRALLSAARLSPRGAPRRGGEGDGHGG
ncbi:MAG: sigma-70 family RNA polymerase sigma factor [Clostridia bacterium]|nr:sigma-70 family RNA polymerase sigma factor [Clostridia bacterium]